ncbi:MAG TPA: hypothetical protein VFW00_10200 [Rhodocyclaceae bacterium]|nr:hypothetical protein [Rhodocyclaceae bacterium]
MSASLGAGLRDMAPKTVRVECRKAVYRDKRQSAVLDGLIITDSNARKQE